MKPFAFGGIDGGWSLLYIIKIEAICISPSIAARGVRVMGGGSGSWLGGHWHRRARKKGEGIPQGFRASISQREKITGG